MTQFVAGRGDRGARRGSGAGRRRLRRPGAAADHRRGGRAARGRVGHQLPAAGGRGRHGARPRRQGCHRLQPRPPAPDQPGPVHGRPLLPGHRGRLPGRAVGRRAPGQVLPDVHDGGRHRAAGQGAGDGRRCGRPAGHRHGPAPGCSGAGLRRARRGQGGGAEPRSQVRRARPRDPGRRRRVRQGAVGRVPGQAAGAAGGRGGGLRRGHHHRPDPRAQGAGPGDRGHGRGHVARARSSSTWPPTPGATAS